jgi:hypothetical protein
VVRMDVDTRESEQRGAPTLLQRYWAWKALVVHRHNRQEHPSLWLTTPVTTHFAASRALCSCCEGVHAR